MTPQFQDREHGSEDQIHKIVKFGLSEDDACSSRSFEFTVMVSIHSWGVIFGLPLHVSQNRMLHINFTACNDLMTFNSGIFESDI